MLLTNRSGFKKALDDSPTICYQHWLALPDAAQNKGFVVGTRHVAATPVRQSWARYRPERLIALRSAAKTRSREAAAGWLASDPDARQAYKSLSDAYVQLGKWDSAVAILSRGNNRPASSPPVTPYRVALLRLISDDTLALPALRDAMARIHPIHSRRAVRLPAACVDVRFTIAGANGAIGLLDTLLRTSIDVRLHMQAWRTDGATRRVYALTMKLATGIRRRKPTSGIGAWH